MDIFFEILKTILPAVITGIITFFITKYTYNNNKPLDKFEIAYNRIYYPLYKLIKSDTKDIEFIINKAKYYLNKYDKYADRSTLRAFNSLCECNSEAKKKDAYENFKENIYNKNSYLRRKLGYLEPSFLQIYTYMSKNEKSSFRILVELLCIYLFVFIGDFFIDEIQSVLNYIAFIFIIVMIIELIYKFVMFLYYKIRK